MAKGSLWGLIGNSILFPTHGAGSVPALVAQIGLQAPTLVCLWSRGADLDCGCLFGGSGRGEQEIIELLSYSYEAQITGLCRSLLLAYSPFSPSPLFPLHNETPSSSQAPSEELRWGRRAVRGVKLSAADCRLGGAVISSACGSSQRVCVSFELLNMEKYKLQIYVGEGRRNVSLSECCSASFGFN